MSDRGLSGDAARILVITPQRDEFVHLLDGLRQNDLIVKQCNYGCIQGAEIPELGMTVAIGGNGKAQFAAQTQYLLSRCEDVGLVICVGAAGTLVENLSTGDIVIATRTVEHDYRERFVEAPLPAHPGDPTALEQLRTLAAASAFPFRVCFEAIASGDEDIVNPQRAQELRAATAAVCVAWEGSGGARAAALSRVPFLEIRAITDFADESAATFFQQNLAKAIHNIPTLLVQCAAVLQQPNLARQ
ncbi:MAG: 5'-methylthioadenosine/S-adenosylhomocysteine nucleosidase [Verrucomicrobiales bacterium]|nr:5'-methylthioadenosine/S-adenosylhomocysteine nucleosidase [Verrucomicrobiales bacterium]